MRRSLCFLVCISLTIAAWSDWGREVFAYEVFLSLSDKPVLVRVEEESDTLYLPSGQAHFLAPIKTLRVPSDPKVGVLRPDLLRVEVQGALMVDSETEPVSLKDFSYRIDLSGKACTPLVGEDARAEYVRFTKEEADYHTAVRAFMEERALLLAERERLGEEIALREEKGLDTQALTAQYEGIVEHEPPQRLSYEVRNPEKGFPLDLEEGIHHIRLVHPEGFTVEGSAKTLIVFSPLERGGTGYEIIPGDRWTERRISDIPFSVFYVQGKPEVFFKAYTEDLYDEFRYVKMLDSAALGIPGKRIFVRRESETKAVLFLSTKDRSWTETMGAFSVEQREGESLGYVIVPYDPVHSEREPDFTAFRLQFPDGADRIRILARDETGAMMRGSVRELRSVDPERLSPWLLVLFLLPIASVPLLRIIRKRSVH